MRHPPLALAERLEAHLGDPGDPGRPFSYQAVLAADLAGAACGPAYTALHDWGLQRYYVPVAHGGDQRDLEQAMHLMRVVARRDLATAIGHGRAYLGAVSVWVAGAADQAAGLGARIIDGALLSWGLTERDHGSDLLANELRAVPVDGGYRLDGEKWLINGASGSELLCLLVRTGPAGGTRGFDLLLVDRARLADGSWQNLPRVRTHGIRSADISGIAFRDSPVPAEALVGSPGSGLETVVKALQLTRTLCSSLSLGCGDTALRLAAGHPALAAVLDADNDADTDANTDGAVRALDRRSLLDAYADQLLDEAVSLVGVRAIHTLPEEMSLVSAAVKYLVPSRTDEIVASAGALLRAASPDGDHCADAGFAKVERDHRIVALFDGNTEVNLHGVVNHFASLARGWRKAAVPDGVAAAFDLGAPLPPFAPERLSLLPRRGAGVLQALPGSVAALEARAAERPELVPLLAPARTLLELAAALHEELAGRRPVPVKAPPYDFALADRWAHCFAGAACLGLWLGSEQQASRGGGATAGLWSGGGWLYAALGRVLAGLGAPPGPDPAVDEAVDLVLAAALREQTAGGLLYSLLPCRLAEGCDDQ